MIYVEYGPMLVTKAQYADVGQRLPDPPEGRNYHVCSGEDGALFVTEVWDPHAHRATVGPNVSQRYANLQARNQPSSWRNAGHLPGSSAASHSGLAA